MSKVMGSLPGISRTKAALGQTGVAMLEVLISLVIVAIGLLGLAGLQANTQMADVEAYQRSQALLLLQDMADRINTNRDDAVNYVTASALGTGDGEPASCVGVTPNQAFDACEWSNALKGAAEQQSATNVGALIGARGCVISTAPNEYVVSVIWQGLSPTSAPAVACGSGLYDTGAPCVGDLCRRAISTVITIATLS